MNKMTSQAREEIAACMPVRDVFSYAWSFQLKLLDITRRVK